MQNTAILNIWSFAYINILDNPEVRENLKVYSNWPTFPQLFIKGELVGGCDIITELYESGELKEMISGAVKDSEDG